MIGRLLDSLRALFGRARFEREMDEELAFHIDQQVADLMRSGVPAPEARRRARAMFGAAEGFKDDAREARGISWIDQLRADLRFAFRTLRRAPGYAAAAVLTLAIGIGANTAIFSVIDGVLLKPLPYPESDRLVRVAQGYPSGALPIYRAESRSYQGIGTYTYDSEVNLLADGLAERVTGRTVSAEFFDILRVTAALGRTFQRGEDLVDAPFVATISDRLWQRRFGADPGVIGRTITVDGVVREVVGVLPRRFDFPAAGTDIWIPNRLDPADVGHVWGAGGTTFIGRLAPGVSLQQADAEHRAMITRIRDAFPWRMPTEYGQAASNHVRSLAQVMGEEVEGRLLLLLAAVGLVLLVACANVTNLNLTRIASREREFAVRQAIGGSRGRISRQVLVEQLVLASLGGALGVAGALVATPLLVRWLPESTPRLTAVAVDGRVLLFTAVVVVFATCLAAVAPMLRAGGVRGSAALGAGGRTAGLTTWGRRVSGALVVVEVALAVVLLVGAGLLMRSLAATLDRDPGIRVEQIVTARITQDLARCDASWGTCSVLFNRIEERLAAIPGVTGVALANMIPLDGQVAWFAMDVEGHPVPAGAPAFELNAYRVTPDYFRIAGIALEEGRLLDRGDTCVGERDVTACHRERLVVVVSRALANRFWPDQSAVGKRIKPVWMNEWARIVGVVADVRQASLATEPTADFYWPIAQFGGATMTAMVQSRLPAAAIEPAIRDAVAGVDAATPVSRVRSMASIVQASVAGSRTTALLLSGFAAVALLLGAIGVYGVLSFSVAQRRREIGVRLAIGAEPGRVRRMIVWQALRLVGGGLVVGVILSLSFAGVLRGFVFGVDVRDPLTLGLVPLVLLVVGVVAAWLPARRATRVSPTVALRAE